MNILPYKLKTTKEQLTSRAGLVIVAQIIKQLELSTSIDRYFPSLKSNRGIAAAQNLLKLQRKGIQIYGLKNFLISSQQSIAQIQVNLL